jgi:Tol biopolymer transport system component
MRKLIYWGCGVILLAGLLCGCGGGSAPKVAPAPAPTTPMMTFASTVDDAAGEIYAVPPGGTVPVRVTSNTAMDAQPVLDMTGRWIAYIETDGNGVDQLWTVQLTVEGAPLEATRNQRTTGTVGVTNPGWGADGTLYCRVTGDDVPNAGDKAGICAVTATGLLPVLEDADNPAGSPLNAKLLAYTQTSQDDGALHLYVIDLTNPSALTDVCALPAGQGIRKLCWSPDGSTLAFENDVIDMTANPPTMTGKVYTVANLAGTAPHQLGDTLASALGPSWISNTALGVCAQAAAGDLYALYQVTTAGAVTPLVTDFGNLARKGR